MGLFDEIKVDISLLRKFNPPSFVNSNYWFQTKQLDCAMQRYQIDKNGYLYFMNNKKRKKINETVNILAYASNLRAAHGPMIFTNKGEDYEVAEYQINIINGKVNEIKEIQRKKEEAAPYELYQELDEIFRSPNSPNFPDKLVGKKLYDSFRKEFVTVVYETDMELCVLNKYKKLNIEIKGISRLWENKKDAIAYERLLQNNYKTKIKLYKKYLRERDSNDQ